MQGEECKHTSRTHCKLNNVDFQDSLTFEYTRLRKREVVYERVQFLCNRYQ